MQILLLLLVLLSAPLLLLLWLHRCALCLCLLVSTLIKKMEILDVWPKGTDL